MFVSLTQQSFTLDLSDYSRSNRCSPEVYSTQLRLIGGLLTQAANVASSVCAAVDFAWPSSLACPGSKGLDAVSCCPSVPSSTFFSQSKAALSEPPSSLPQLDRYQLPLLPTFNSSVPLQNR